MSAAGAVDVLICAGLDPSGGAGLIADVRIASALGARPIGVVTALTVQDTHGVRAAQPVDPELVGAQLAAVLSDIEVRAVKLGLLGSLAVAHEISRALELTAAPVVWDPVAAPTLGGLQFDTDLGPYLEVLAPHLALITPNLDELHHLTGAPRGELEAARRLAAHARVAVLVTGGHGDGGAEVVDTLFAGGEVVELRAPRVPGGERVHGTGCALSTSIATRLALGVPLREACRAAQAEIGARIAAPVRPGRGAPAIL